MMHSRLRGEKYKFIVLPFQHLAKYQKTLCNLKQEHLTKVPFVQPVQAHSHGHRKPCIHMREKAILSVARWCHYASVTLGIWIRS